MSRRAVQCLPVWLILALACSKQDATPQSIPPAAAGHGPMRVADAADDSDDTDDADLPQVDGDATVKAIVALGHTDNKVTEHVAYLTEDIGPRLTGSHRLMVAEQWCRDQFASWGLDAKLEKWGDFPVGFDRGPWSGGMVTPEEIDYDFITPAWTPGAVGPVQGKATLYPKSLAELKRRKAELKGAWVVRPRDWDIDRKLRDKIDDALGDVGPAGLVVSDRNEAGELVHTYGDSDIEWTSLPTLVKVNLRADQHRDLVERLEASEAVQLALSIDNRFFNGPVPQHNVIADLVGSEKPDEIVVVGGHLDSWDGATGANDNGTGVATTLEAARLLVAAGAKPKRTIRFMLWSGEEQGLLGSRWFAAHPMVPLRDTVAVINMDALFPFGRTHGMTVVAKGSTELEPYFAEAAATVERELFADTAPEAGAFFRSDHYPFAERGVPAIFAVGGPSQRPEHNPERLVPRYMDYLTRRYHQPADEYDPETWDLAGIVQDVTIYFRAGLAIAQDDRFPNWAPGHRFRPLRDAMRRSDAAASG